MEFDMTKMVEKITTQVKESQEEFIFETIYPYCEDVLQLKINKEELKQILLNGKRNLQTSDDCIRREEAIRIAEQGQIQGFEWQIKKLCALPPVKPESFINKPCISEGVCREDKMQVLDKLRAELIQSIQNGTLKIESGNEELFRIIDKYEEEGGDNE